MTRIVIVDDRVTNRRILSRLAMTLGDDIDVSAHPDPMAALEECGHAVADLIITDFKMPGMDGAEFIEKFRALPDCEDVPVIVVSVYEHRSYRYKALLAGATDFLMSPVDHFEFKTRARNLLTLRRQQELLKERALTLEDQLEARTREHHKALSDSRERLLAVIDTVPAMIYATDNQSRCIFINRYALAFAKGSAESCDGQPATDLFGTEKGERDEAQAAPLLAGDAEIDPYEETITTASGERLTFLTKKVALKDPGGATAVLTVSVDISARKAMEEALVAAKEEPDKVSRAKTEFLANMSHELRTPLNAIIGFSQMIETEQLGPINNPRYRDYVSHIGSSANHLLGIINDILDLARIEEGKLSLQDGQIDIAHVVDEATTMVRQAIRGKELTFSITTDPDLPVLLGDEKRLRQVVINLVANAAKFSNSGATVDVAARVMASGGIQIDVTDTGIGMTAEEIEIAMSRFGQIFPSPEMKRYEGVGLGIPLSIALVEMHGGTVEIDSVPDEGTTVSVRFPASRTIDCRPDGALRDGRRTTLTKATG